MNKVIRNIAFLSFALLLAMQGAYAISVPEEGSRLFIKTNIKTKALIVPKASTKIAQLSRNLPNYIVLKPSKAVNLYFTTALLNKNQSKPYKEIINTVAYKQDYLEKEESIAADGGEKLFYADGVYVSNIYPNPADDFANFDYSISNNNIKDLKIEFFTVIGSPTGEAIFLDKSDKKVKVQLKDFLNGVYLYSLVADGKTLATKKLLIRHNN